MSRANVKLFLFFIYQLLLSTTICLGRWILDIYLVLMLSLDEKWRMEICLGVATRGLRVADCFRLAN